MDGTQPIRALVDSYVSACFQRFDRVKELKWSAERSVGAAHEMYISRGALTRGAPARTKPRGDTAGEGSAAHCGDLGEYRDFLGTS